MLRWLLLIPLALMLSLSVFSFMALLLAPEQQFGPEQVAGVNFNVIQLESQLNTQRRVRPAPLLPKQPQSIPVSKQSPVSKHIAAPQKELLHSLLKPSPVLAMELSPSGLAISAPLQESFNTLADSGATSKPSAESLVEQAPAVDVAHSQQVMPLHRVEPQYPAKALRRKKEGYVVVNFSINTDGSPVDIEVVEAQPGQLFVREALRAIKRWKYLPMMVNGVATRRGGQVVKLEFKLRP